MKQVIFDRKRSFDLHVSRLYQDVGIKFEERIDSPDDAVEEVSE